MWIPHGQQAPKNLAHTNEVFADNVMVALSNLETNKLLPLIKFQREPAGKVHNGDQASKLAPRHVMRQMRLDIDRQQQAAIRYAAGEPVGTICADFNIHRSTLHSICRRLEVRRSQGVVRNQQKRKATELYQSGYTLADIAKQFHISPGKVRRMLVESGIEIRPRGRNTTSNI